MVEGCCAKTSKFLLVSLNLLIFIFGAVLLGVCIASYKSDKFSSKVIKASEDVSKENNLSSITAVRALYIGGMVVGSIALVISFFGCCGAMMESTCLLVTYTIILGILIVFGCCGDTGDVMKCNDVFEDKDKWECKKGHNKECGDAIIDKVYNMGTARKAIAGVAAAVEILAVVFAIIVMCNQGE